VAYNIPIMKWLVKLRERLGRRALLIGAVVVGVGLGLWHWRYPAGANPKPTDEYIVKPGRISQEITLPGRLEFDRQAVLKFQTSGLLSWVGVKTGDRVKKGQAIASLDRRQLYKQLKKALNDYYKTRLDFEDTEDEYRDVLDRSMTIQRLLEKNQKDLDNSVIDVELKHIAWRLAVITAPFDGVIDDLDLPSPGVNITPAKATFKLIDPDSLYFKAEVDEMDIDKVTTNLPVKVELDAYPEASLSAKIDYISLTATTGRGGAQVYPAKIVLTDTDTSLPLRAGLSGQAIVQLAVKANVLIVPVDYVYFQKGQPYVWLKTAKGQLTKRFITTGLESDEFIEVIQGLALNDTIVKK